jgi:hypothetical protein
MYYNGTDTIHVHSARKTGVFCIDRCNLSPEFRIIYTSVLLLTLRAKRKEY